MNIYIAGISIGETLHRFSSKIICNEIIRLFPTILQEAKQLSDDVVTIIILQEYALTKKPISHAMTQELLGLLQRSMSHFRNTILIPGSFANYQPLVEIPHKLKKIQDNYLTTKTSFLNQDRYFSEEFKHFSNRIKKPLYENICFENSSYILTNKDKIKHKKSCPWNERDILFGHFKEKAIFYIGIDRSQKNIMLENDSLNIDLSICREHIYPQISNSAKENFLSIDVIISDSIIADKESFNGALSLQMDSEIGLNVYRNIAHHANHKITNVLAKHYTKNARHEADSSKQIDILEYQPKKQNQASNS